MKLQNLGVQELNQKELKEIEGGVHPALVVLAVVCVVAFAVGVYNGYQDAAAEAAKE